MIAPEKRNEIVAWLTESELRPEAKERALAILRKPELAEEDTDTILEIIQSDIKADLAEAGMLDDGEYEAFVARQEAEIAEVEKVAQETLDAAEAHIQELDELATELGKKEDEGQLGDVKSRLGME